MRKPQRRLLYLILVAPPVLVLTAALLYMLGMSTLEGSPRGFWDSLGWASETLTTTGYGADSRWHHPLMVLFTMTVQFVGVFLVYLVFPLYLIPYLEERFQARLPRSVDTRLERHVVIYRWGPAVESLALELAEVGVPVVIVEPEESVARPLFESGRQILHRSLADGALAGVQLERARALIANGADDENAAVILAARQLGFAQAALAVVEEPIHRRPMMLAGASAVFTPRHILGAALAARASARIDPRVSGVQQLGAQLEVIEVRLEGTSPLVGRTLREAALRTKTGATILGQWVDGRLIAPPPPEMRLVDGGILVALGSEAGIDALTQLARGTVALRRRGPFLVGGFGEVGGKVAELLREVGEEVRVVDRVGKEGVDVVGSLIDPRILDKLEVSKAQAVILALDSDASTLFATVVLKDLAPEVPVIARVNQAENVERIRRAGAHFALSISQVSGQMLARRLLGQEAVSVDPQLEVLRVSSAGLEGSTLASLDIRDATGCSIVAVERGAQVLVDFGPTFRFESGDAIYVFGSTADVRRFSERVGQLG